jgi:predicted small secreted protein
MQSKARARDRAPLFLVPLSALVVLSALLLGGCNTISGAGKDVAAVGRGVDTTAEAAEDKMFGTTPAEQEERARRGGY